MSEVINALRREHDALSKLLDALERQLVEFDQGRRPDYDIVQGVIDYCLSFPDLYHHPKEDLVYARMKARNPAKAETVGDLLGEHESLAELTRRFAEAVRNVLDEAEISREGLLEVAYDFLGHYRRHIAGEEEVFFPAAFEVLTPEDWQAIEAEVEARLDPLFGHEPEQRFVLLREHVLAWDRDQQMAGEAS
jgi:hemerythrin-like domain-containing protein